MKKIKIEKLACFLPIEYGILSIFIVYIGEANARIFISPDKVLLPALLLGVIGFLLYLIFWAIIRKGLPSAVIACLCILGLLFIWRMFLVVLLTVVVCLPVFSLVLKKKGVAAVAMALQVLAFTFGVFYGFQYVGILLQTPAAPARLPTSITGNIHASTTTPDIYYIILDGYGRTEMLKAVHGLDNSAFQSELEKRGFILPPQSQANYPRTLLSLTSSLNMEYLDQVVSQLNGANYWWLLEPTLKQNAVRSILEREGYQTYFFSSGWDFTDIRNGDHYMKPYPVMLNDFERAFVEMTNLSFLENVRSRFISLPTYDTHRQIIRYQFQTLPEVARKPGQKFVFSHILNPHPPFVFDQNGGPINPDYPYTLSYSKRLLGTPEEYEASYVAQLKYDNSMILKMIDGILANSAYPPIIILQGDHGPGVFADFDDLNKMCLYERYSILNAYYFPDPRPETIPADIGPVNTFRLIFQQYFGLDTPLLPEKRFFSSNQDFYNFQDFSNFQDISSRTNLACENQSTQP